MLCTEEQPTRIIIQTTKVTYSTTNAFILYYSMNIKLICLCRNGTRALNAQEANGYGKVFVFLYTELYVCVNVVAMKQSSCKWNLLNVRLQNCLQNSKCDSRGNIHLRKRGKEMWCFLFQVLGLCHFGNSNTHGSKIPTDSNLAPHLPYLGME